MATRGVEVERDRTTLVSKRRHDTRDALNDYIPSREPHDVSGISTSSLRSALFAVDVRWTRGRKSIILTRIYASSDAILLALLYWG